MRQMSGCTNGTQHEAAAGNPPSAVTTSSNLHRLTRQWAHLACPALSQPYRLSPVTNTSSSPHPHLRAVRVLEADPRDEHRILVERGAPQVHQQLAPLVQHRLQAPAGRSE